MMENVMGLAVRFMAPTGRIRCVFVEDSGLASPKGGKGKEHWHDFSLGQ